MIFRWQAEDPGKLMVYFQSVYKDLRTKGVDGVSSSLRAGDWFLFSSSQVEREWILPSSISLFLSGFQGFQLWGPRCGRQTVLLTLSIQMLISSRNIFTDNTVILFSQISGHPMAQSSKHIKNNYYIRGQEKLDWILFHMIGKDALL